MNVDNGPISIDLAREADFSVGAIRVRPSLRQVEAGTDSETLEPRVMQVLVALIRRKGEVVSRDELIQACWAGRIVGDDAISRVIARVRKLGETHGAFTLETIPRVGYRLMTCADAAEAAPTSANYPQAPAAPARPVWARPVVWGGAVVAIAVLLAAFVMRPQPVNNVDEVVARLSERLQQQSAGAGDMRMAGDAMRELGMSSGAEERTAFAALASDDGENALDILEDLARQLETSGDPASAAQAWRRVGAIAPLFDQSRAVAAQRRAFDLAPNSLVAFQSLFFITFLQDTMDTEHFVDGALRHRLTEQMHGWVLAHRAYYEVELVSQPEQAQQTLAEIKALKSFASDKTLQVSALWVEAVLAFAAQDLSRAETLARQAMADWAAIPEKTSNSPEIILFRILFEKGDWKGAFAMGADMFERRSREGDLLPGVVGWSLCEAGLFTGQGEKALPYCQSSARRREGHPARVKGFAGLSAVLEGDTARAVREFETAQGIIPPSGSIPALVQIYEAWAAAHAGDYARAEEVITRKPGGQTWEQATARRPAILAMAQRLRGEWLIAAGRPQQACAPLASAGRVYASFAGDAGREAVETVQTAAGCRVR